MNTSVNLIELIIGIILMLFAVSVALVIYLLFIYYIAKVALRIIEFLDPQQK
jgi:hypothetical protein